MPMYLTNALAAPQNITHHSTLFETIIRPVVVKLI